MRFTLFLILFLFCTCLIIGQPANGHPLGTPAPFPFIGILAFIGSILGVRYMNRPEGKD